MNVLVQLNWTWARSKSSQGTEALFPQKDIKLQRGKCVDFQDVYTDINGFANRPSKISHIPTIAGSRCLLAQ